MKHFTQSIIFVALTVIASFATSEQAATSSVSDSRIKQLNYDPLNVYKIISANGVATTIFFGADEYLTDWHTGFKDAFYVKPAENYVVVKPKFVSARTNLTLITSMGRVYNFEIDSLSESEAKRRNDLTYQVTFNYLEGSNQANLEAHKQLLAEREQAQVEAVMNEIQCSPANGDITVNPLELDFSWEFAGDADIAPLVTFDDGVFTYMQFPKNSSIPAIFGIKRDRSEYAVNYHIEGNYVVIEGLLDAYSLRVGDMSVTVRNIDARKWMANTRYTTPVEKGGSIYE